MYNCVVPVMDYCSSIWGYKKYQQIDNVQNRAMRFYLGVHRYAPIAAISGDLGWVPSQYRRRLNMLKLWNRLVNFNSDRITKLAFDQDYVSAANAGLLFGWLSAANSGCLQWPVQGCFKRPMLACLQQLIVAAISGQWLGHSVSFGETTGALSRSHRQPWVCWFAVWCCLVWLARSLYPLHSWYIFDE